MPLGKVVAILVEDKADIAAFENYSESLRLYQASESRHSSISRIRLVTAFSEQEFSYDFNVMRSSSGGSKHETHHHENPSKTDPHEDEDDYQLGWLIMLDRGSQLKAHSWNSPRPRESWWPPQP